MNCSEIIPTKSMELFELWLRDWTPKGKKVAIVYGGTGVGKTTTIYCVSEKLGYEVVTFDYETGASYADILRRTRARGWPKPIVVHLDRPFEEMGLKGKQLAKIIKQTVNPIAIETTEPKMYKWTTGAEIEVKPPSKVQIAQLLRKNALIKPNFRLVGSDIRQALFLGYGASVYETRDWLRTLQECLKTGNCEDIEDSHLPALLDSYVKHCYGLECIKAVELLVAADITKKPHIVLQEFTIGRGIAQPEMYFYKKWKAVKESEKTNNRS